MRTAAVFLALALCAGGPLSAQGLEERTMVGARQVLQELGTLHFQHIPQTLLGKAEGLVIIPNVVRGAFVVGIQHGRGVVLAKDEAGNWMPPQFLSLTGGSFGWQAGLQSTDLVLVFQTRKSVANLLTGKITIGVDAAAAAGPVGRRAALATDLPLKAEILSYSRSRGLFAGVSIDGSSLQIDAAANARYYGQTGGALPASAELLMVQVGTLTASRTTIPAAVSAGPPAGPGGEISRAARRLHAMLDPGWQSYLRTGELVSAGDGRALGGEAWLAISQRFEAVAMRPEYEALAHREEFQTLRRLLQNAGAAENSARLQLPPPPAGTKSISRGRY